MSTNIIDDRFKRDIINKNYMNLGTEIVIQAVKDYQRAVIFNDRDTMNECEAFFHSGWYELLTDIEPELVMYYARTRVKRIYSR